MSRHLRPPFKIKGYHFLVFPIAGRKCIPTFNDVRNNIFKTTFRRTILI